MVRCEAEGKMTIRFDEVDYKTWAVAVLSKLQKVDKRLSIKFREFSLYLREIREIRCKI